jgi:succinyldiaminopimelate transaminase
VQLPDFPWDSLREAKNRAGQHHEGLIDLSVGSPVDDTVDSAVSGLARASNSPGYPATAGSPELIQAMVSWWQGERGARAVNTQNVLPVIGSKEMIALMPFMLGLGKDDVVVHPAISYPTYEVGAMAVGATPLPEDDPEKWPVNTALVWINSPSNPTGRVLDTDQLRRSVHRARQIGAVLVSDECYGLLGSDTHPIAPSVLSDDVVAGDYTGVLALHSLSKQANMAGYRAAFMAGDATLIGSLLELRKHLGLMVPGPIQSAVASALADTHSVAIQREKYSHRRRIIRDAFVAAGFEVHHSEAGLYLWATRGEPADDSVAWLAERGILVTPGHFYGDAGKHHIRVALTVSDQHAEAVFSRLSIGS